MKGFPHTACTRPPETSKMSVAPGRYCTLEAQGAAAVANGFNVAPFASSAPSTARGRRIDAASTPAARRKISTWPQRKHPQAHQPGCRPRRSPVGQGNAPGAATSVGCVYGEAVSASIFQMSIPAPAEKDIIKRRPYHAQSATFAEPNRFIAAPAAASAAPCCRPSRSSRNSSLQRQQARPAAPPVRVIRASKAAAAARR